MTTHAPSRPSRLCAVLAQLVCAVLIGLGLLALPLAGEPAEASTGDGLWYYDEFGIDALHEAGHRGQGVTVALFDSPINLESPDLSGQQIEPRTDKICSGYSGIETGEVAEHGTGMASIIVGNGTGFGSGSQRAGVKGIAPDARLLHYAVIDTPKSCRPSLHEAVADALEAGATILSFSIGWGSSRDIEEAFAAALAKGAIIDVAVQNENGDESDPISGANGVVSIENVDDRGHDDGMRVTSPRLDFVAPGIDIRALMGSGHDAWESYGLTVGTSPAAAWTSGVFALASSAWPHATPNQLLQSAIRTTSNEEWKPLERTDEEGFGLLSPQNLASINPTGFPDENPLIHDEDEGKTKLIPTPQEIFGSGGRGAQDPGITTVSHERGTSIPSSSPNRTAEEVGAPIPSADTEPRPEAAPTNETLLMRAAGEVLLVVAVGLIVVLIIATIAGKRRRPATVAAVWGPGMVPGSPYGGAPMGYLPPSYRVGPGYGPGVGAQTGFGGGLRQQAPYAAGMRGPVLQGNASGVPDIAAGGGLVRPAAFVPPGGTAWQAAPFGGGYPARPVTPTRGPLPASAPRAPMNSMQPAQPAAPVSTGRNGMPLSVTPSGGWRETAASVAAPASSASPSAPSVPPARLAPPARSASSARLAPSAPPAPHRAATPPPPPPRAWTPPVSAARATPRATPRFADTKPYELSADFWPQQVIKAKPIDEYRAPEPIKDADSER